MERIFWADHVKAFAIWLMVLCHFGMNNEYWETVICSFHMPIFFFLSGYFEKGREYSHAILKRTARALLVPYFFFSVCAFSICWVSPLLHPELYHHGSISDSFVKAFVGMFLMEDQVRSYAFMPMGALWFLVALFWVRVFFSIGCTLWRAHRLFLLPFTVLLLLIFLFRFPFFSLDSACLALPIYFAGYLCHRQDILRLVGRNLVGLVFTLAGISYILFVSVHNGYVSMDGCLYGDSLLMFYVNAIVGSLSCIAFFKLLSIKSLYLNRIGASTITILGTHTYFGKVGYVIGVLLLSISPSTPPVWFPFLLSVIAVPVGGGIHSWLSRKYPFVLGK